MIELIAAAIAGLAAGAVIGGAVTAWVLCHKREPTKLLAVGCSVKYHGRVWKIKRFMFDSENQTIAEIESRDNGEHIIRRTMVPVEELEVSE